MSEKDQIDQGKRKLLVAATAVMGGVATGATAVPFVASMLPSERTKAAGAPVEVSLADIELGTVKVVEWRGKPVWIVHRTPDMVETLTQHNNLLADPDSDRSIQPEYCKNPNRSIKPEFLVTLGICTHLGCSPTFRKDVGAADLGADWPGGFYCPCHGSLFDLSARVFKNKPAPQNLEVPPYQYLGDAKLLIGDDSKGA
jgi:ubiquinol-cytochrome c reductase iron-sulfur subunit